MPKKPAKIVRVAQCANCFKLLNEDDDPEVLFICEECDEKYPGIEEAYGKTCKRCDIQLFGFYHYLGTVYQEYCPSCYGHKTIHEEEGDVKDSS